MLVKVSRHGLGVYLAFLQGFIPEVLIALASREWNVTINKCTMAVR